VQRERTVREGGNKAAQGAPRGRENTARGDTRAVSRTATGEARGAREAWASATNAQPERDGRGPAAATHGGHGDGTN